MRNNYDYIDPDYTYTNPKTGVLRKLDVYERYIAGTIEGDIEKLTALILELMQNA